MSTVTECPPPSSDDVVAVVDADEPVAASKPFDLSAFRLERVLSNATQRKMVCCLGRFSDRGQPGDRAIVILEKTAFAESDLSPKAADGDDDKTDAGASTTTFFSPATELRQLFVNDIYGNFECFPCPEINRVKTTIIFPATEQHIVKHSTQEVFIFDETPDDYATKTLPYLESEQFSLDWVYNILEHRKEQERIIFDDPCPRNGFVLLPDLKWDGRTRETLYLLAIVRRRDLRSLRSLRAADLPLLRHVRDAGTQAIRERYGVSGRELRTYLHYQPSFYHLHVHFTYVQHEAPGVRCERGHLLSTVIGNLELLGDYYERATLPFTVVKQSKLYEIYAAADDELQPEAKRPKLDAEE